VADEHLVFDGHALADEAVRGDLAALADDGVLLDFDERADLRVGPDRASVEIHERGLEDPDVVAKLDRIGNRQSLFPWCLTSWVAGGYARPQGAARLILMD
jgi:hypothetical protein